MRRPDYSRIPWRKLHTAPPPSLRASWGCLDLHARGLYWLLLSATEQDGSILLDEVGLSSVAGLLFTTWEAVEPSLTTLLTARWVQHDTQANVLRLTHFEDSQEAVSPEAERKRRQRERAGRSDEAGHAAPDTGTVTGQSRDSHGTVGDTGGTVTTELRIKKREERTKTQEEKRETPPSFPQGSEVRPLNATEALAALVQGMDPTQDPLADGWERAWEPLQCPSRAATDTGLPPCAENGWCGVWLGSLAKCEKPPTAEKMRQFGRWWAAGGAADTRKAWFSQLHDPVRMADWYARSQAWDGVRAVNPKRARDGPYRPDPMTGTDRGFSSPEEMASWTTQTE
jgi:hypothetical protein